MTALRLSKINTDTSTAPCDSEGCTRKGRYAMLIAGYPVPSQSPYADLRRTASLCPHCAGKAKALWAELTGEQPETFNTKTDELEPVGVGA